MFRHNSFCYKMLIWGLMNCSSGYGFCCLHPWPSAKHSSASLHPLLAPCKSCCGKASGSMSQQEQAQMCRRCGVLLAVGFWLSLDGAWLEKQLGTDERKFCLDSMKKRFSKSVIFFFFHFVLLSALWKICSLKKICIFHRKKMCLSTSIHTRPKRQRSITTPALEKQKQG